MGIDVFKTKAEENYAVEEGDYNTWICKWIAEPSNGIRDYDEVDVLIDERNGKLSIGWRDLSSDDRFGLYNLSDFSAVFESPLGTNYRSYYATTYSKQGIEQGLVYLTYGGVSQSIQTYLLISRDDNYTIEVWRGGATALWSTNTQTDFGSAVSKCYVGGISLTGKYVLVVIDEYAAPYHNYLMLYEGFNV